jgi:hypothetical protein
MFAFVYDIISRNNKMMAVLDRIGGMALDA